MAMGAGVLASYVPAALLRAVARRQLSGPERWDERSDGIVVFTDISGFTPLTERLADRGSAGAEILAHALNQHFDEVVGIITTYGGEVFRYAGDATIAIWSTESDPERAGRQAASCALALQRAITAREPIEGVQLTARSGIDSGTLWSGSVGGTEGRWEFIVGGTPLERAAKAAGAAPRGEILVTDAAWELIAASARGEHSGAGIRLVAVSAVSDPPGTGTLAPSVPDVAVEAYIPRGVVARLGAGQSDWLGSEFRRVSIVFVGVHGLDASRGDFLDRVHGALHVMQRVVYRLEGSIRQILQDDKGLTMIAAWGVPSHTHEDDAARAAEAGLEAVQALVAAGLDVGAGVTTGRAFCGEIGNRLRRDYALVGDVVNLSARLMQSAHGGALCDIATATAASGHLAFRETAPLRLKGKSETIVPWEPSAIREVRPTHAAQIVGREKERAQLDGMLEDLRNGVGRNVLIEGEPGIGKSALIAHLAERARAQGIRTIASAADAVERNTAYFVWRVALRRMLDADGPDKLSARALSLLDRDVRLFGWAPLLEEILPLGLTETESTQQMDSAGRAFALRSVLVGLLRGLTTTDGLLLILDDGHWIDSASWGLITEVAGAELQGVLLVLASRPLAAKASDEQRRIVDSARTVTLRLGPLEAGDATELVQQRLGVERVPADISTYVVQRAGGNPFFGEQLVLALRDRGVIAVVGDHWDVSPAIQLAELELPGTVEGIVAGRIDLLPPAGQLGLKVASVIGRSFGERILTDVHPVATDRPALRAHLDEYVRLQLTEPERPDPERTDLFKHVITQQVAYGLLVFEQRRELHRAVARWIENNISDLDPYLPLLAHHWQLAEDEVKALEYLERAGQQALGRHANEEAVRFLSAAVAIAEKAEGSQDARRRASWERGIGQALVKLARYAESVPHFEAALRLSGDAAPRGPTMAALASLLEVARQIIHRVRGVRVADAPEDRFALAERSDIYRYLTEARYWGNQLPAMMHAAFRALNLAERGGESPQLVNALCQTGLILGSSAMHPPARFYFQRTREVAARVRDLASLAHASEVEAAYFGGVGDWTITFAAAERGAAVFERLGDRMRWHTCSAQTAYVHIFEGRYNLARPILDEGLRTVGASASAQALVWGHAGIALCDLADGSVDQDRLVALAAAATRPELDRSDQIVGHGVLALVRARQGDHARAGEHARLATRAIDPFPPASWYTMLGGFATADAYWALAEADRATWSGALHHSARGLAWFARFYPAARPHARLAAGRCGIVDGHLARARRALADAIARADGLGMRGQAVQARIALAGIETDAVARGALLDAAARMANEGGMHSIRGQIDALRDISAGAGAPPASR